LSLASVAFRERRVYVQARILLPHCGVTFNLSIGQGTTLSDIVFTQQLLAEVQIETDAIIFQIVSLAREY
jgi:hypothetical protein